MSSPSCRYAKKRKSPTDAALTTEQPLTSIHTSSKSSSAEDHSSKLLEQNNQRNNDSEADFLSFLTKMSNSVRGLTDHFVCPVCLDFLSNAHVAPECLHHFCGNCIKESLHRCKNECPSCRARISTRRSLRHDKSYDLIVSWFIHCGLYIYLFIFTRVGLHIVNGTWSLTDAFCNIFSCRRTNR